jgi:hypothetical protein
VGQQSIPTEFEESMAQRYAVVVCASDPSDLAPWGAGGAPRNWSLVVVSDGKVPPAAFRGHADLVAAAPGPGPHWQTLVSVLAARPDLWQDFDLLWFPEPGLQIDIAKVADFFALAEAMQLQLSQPATVRDDTSGDDWSASNASFYVRYSNRIDAVAPCLSRQLLGRVLSLASSLPAPLEFSLPRLLADQPRRCAIVDAITVRRAGTAPAQFWQTGNTPAPSGDAPPDPICYGGIDRAGTTLSLFDDTGPALIRQLAQGLGTAEAQTDAAAAMVAVHERARAMAIDAPVAAAAGPKPPVPAALPSKESSAVLAAGPRRPKVYIYHELITNPALRELNVKLAHLNRLGQHLQYLEDFYAFFRQHETRDPDEADLFFVPLFLAGWQFANADPRELIDQHCTHRNRGNHVLLASGDFGQRSESRHEMTAAANPQRAYHGKYPWLDTRFRLLALESTASLLAQDVAFLPYCTRRVDRPGAPKDILLSFMGAMSYPFLAPGHIRGTRLLAWRKTVTHAAIVVGTVEEVQVRLGCMASYDEVMARSVFTLCPAGYGRWSFRLVEALLNESIPVVLADDYVLPFGEEIRWDDYAYVLPESQLDTLQDFVASVPIGEVQRKLANIRRDRHLFEKAAIQERVLARLMAPVAAEDPAQSAIRRMRGPEQMGIICVDVTNKCDLACSNCTRLLVNQDHYWEMSPENFRTALRSLRGYPGIIAMIGGNPCMHTRFEELCEIFREEIPDQRQRGLWTNNIFKHGGVIEATFGALNLNPHDNPRAVGALQALYQRMVVERGFNGGYYAGYSEHAPMLTAVRDLYGEREMWEKIAGCEINRDWSASIVQNQGQLRAYFCEVAASFDLARNEDHGLAVTPGWWRKPLQDFSSQVRRFCPGCGVPARLKGHMDHEETDTYTVSNADIAAKAAGAKKRKVVLMSVERQADLGHRVTKYAGNPAPATVS